MTVRATPADVWSVLADPELYADWVVGSSEIMRADQTWPAAGATLEHRQGVRPVRLPDTTTVLQCEPGRRLVLEARARPLAVNRVDITIAPHTAGAEVTIVELPTGGLGAALPRRATDPLLHMRNLEGLRRLRRLVERRAGATGGA